MCIRDREINCEPLSGPNTTFWSIKKDNKKIGKVTSAVYSPRLKKNIALAMINVENSKIGTSLEVKTNKGNFKAIVVEKPFFDPKKKIASN